MKLRGSVIALMVIVYCSVGFCQEVLEHVPVNPAAVSTGVSSVVKAHESHKNPGHKKEARPNFMLSVKLEDGSVVYGAPRIKTLDCLTGYASMKIPFNFIYSITVEDDNEHASLTMKNGDKLSVIISLGDLVMITVFGEVSLPIEHIDQITVYSGKLSMDGLVLHYSFDNEPVSSIPEKVLSKSVSEGFITVEKQPRAKACIESVRAPAIPPPAAKPESAGVSIFDNTADMKASVHGAKWIKDGHSGGAYWFDGVNDYIKLPDEAKQKGPFTVSIWFTQEKPDQKGSLYGGGGCDAQIDRNGIAMTWVPANKSFYFDVYDKPKRYAVTMTTSEVNFVDGQWHHAVGTYDGNYLALYIDGKLSKSGKREIGKINIDWSRADHILGNRGEIDYYYKWYWKGKMDELMIFNRALGDQEVNELYRLK